jgi:hypothetical protein
MDHLTHEEKKQYIYQNIDTIKNHSLFIKILETNEIKYTKNTNGIFLNLNSLEDDIINDFYNIIFYKNDNKIECDYLDKEMNEHFEKIDQINKDKIEKNKIEKIENTIINNDKYLLKNFNKRDQKIISLSKKRF